MTFALILHRPSAEPELIASGFPTLRSAWTHTIAYLDIYTLTACRLSDAPGHEWAEFIGHLPNGSHDRYEIVCAANATQA